MEATDCVQSGGALIGGLVMFVLGLLVIVGLLSFWTKTGTLRFREGKPKGGESDESGDAGGVPKPLGGGGGGTGSFKI